VHYTSSLLTRTLRFLAAGDFRARPHVLLAGPSPSGDLFWDFNLKKNPTTTTTTNNQTNKQQELLVRIQATSTNRPLLGIAFENSRITSVTSQGIDFIRIFTIFN